MYDGSREGWHESDPVAPINGYGRSKAAAEAFLQQHWPRHVSLRSSIIYGPQPPVPVGRALFLQFIETALRRGQPATFFDDEFRNPIYVQVRGCLAWPGESFFICMEGRCVLLVCRLLLACFKGRLSAFAVASRRMC